MVRRGELRSYRSKPSLSRRQVEAVAASLDAEDVRRIRTHGADLVGRQEAAAIVGVSPGRVTQLADVELIPFETLPMPGGRGRRMYRREQLVVVANARDARWARWP